MKHETIVYTVWSLDVWGNPKDGFEVNDRCRIGTISVRAEEQIYNEGTEHEFRSFVPSHAAFVLALKQAGHMKRGIWRSSVAIDGEHDGLLMVDEVRSGKPVWQLECLEPAKLDARYRDGRHLKAG